MGMIEWVSVLLHFSCEKIVLDAISSSIDARPGQQETTYQDLEPNRSISNIPWQNRIPAVLQSDRRVRSTGSDRRDIRFPIDNSFPASECWRQSAGSAGNPTGDDDISANEAEDMEIDGSSGSSDSGSSENSDFEWTLPDNLDGIAIDANFLDMIDNE